MSDIGERSVAAWQKAFGSGDFGDLEALCDPAIVFRFGVAPYHTERKGSTELRGALDFLRAKQICVVQEPLSPPLHGASSTVFEFRATGSAGDYQFQADFLIVFGFHEGRIVRMVEYAPPAG